MPLIRALLDCVVHYKFTYLPDHTSFIPISARTDVYKYSFFPRTLLDWNTLPAEIRLKYSLSVSESADLVD